MAWSQHRGQSVKSDGLSSSLSILCVFPFQFHFHGIRPSFTWLWPQSEASDHHSTTTLYCLSRGTSVLSPVLIPQRLTGVVSRFCLNCAVSLQGTERKKRRSVPDFVNHTCIHWVALFVRGKVADWNLIKINDLHIYMQELDFIWIFI